jgi:DNA polymerase-3 subunit epsilon
MPYVDALQDTGEVVEPPIGPLAAASAEETERILHWLEGDGVRLVSVSGEWTCPVHGAGGQRWQLEPLAARAGEVSPFDEPRTHRPLHRPPGAVPSGRPETAARAAPQPGPEADAPRAAAG